MMMIPVILVTIMFTFGGGQVTLSTEVKTMAECEEIIQSITTTVGEDNIQLATCEEKYKVSE